MSLKKEDYNIINYVKTYGPDVFDPVDYEKTNKNIYDKNFIDLLDHILQLSKNKLKQIEEKKKEMQYPDIIEIRIYTLSDLKKLIRELILLLNDLLKIFINLYNLEMGVSTMIENGDYDILIKNKDMFENFFIKTNSSKEYIENFYKEIPVKKEFIPMEYNEYKVDILNNFTTDEELIALSDYLLNECSKLEQGIKKLLNLSKKLSFIVDTEEISKLILNQIVPENYYMKSYEDPILMQIGGSGKVIEAYTKLNELKGYLDGVSSVTLDKEIPSGINMEIDDVKKILNDFKIKIQTQSKPANDVDADKYKKKLEYNLFEEIPDYKRINYGDKFIKNPLIPTTPEDTMKIQEVQKLIDTVDAKSVQFLQKIEDIKTISRDLVNFEKKISIYKESEFVNIPTFNYKFSNIGNKSDISTTISKLEKDIKDKKDEITQKQTEKDNKTKLVPILDDSNFITYITKNYELETRPVSDKSKDLLELKTLIAGADNIENNEIKDIFKQNLNKVFENRLKTVYTSGFFLDNANYEKYDKIIELFIASMKAAQSSTVPGKVGFITLNLPLKKDLVENILGKIQKNGPGLGVIPPIYKDIKKKLEEMQIKYPGSGDVLQTEITTLETANPTYITQYADLKTDTTFDFKNIPTSVLTKKGGIQSEITVIDNAITTLNTDVPQLETQVTNLKTTLTSFSENTNYQDMINIDDTKFKGIILLLHQKLDEINKKMRILFNLKEGSSNNSLMETSISTSLNDINQKWFDKSFKIGGNNYEFNINNINKINDLNTVMKKLLVKVEKYKSVSSDLLENYISVTKTIQDVIIYIYYKLTVFNDIKKKLFIINKKYTKDSLETLKTNINSISRKNFSLFKEYYIKIIEDILKKQQIEKTANKENEYVKYDHSEKSILNLFILAHIDGNLNVF